MGKVAELVTAASSGCSPAGTMQVCSSRMASQTGTQVRFLPFPPNEFWGRSPEGAEQQPRVEAGPAVWIRRPRTAGPSKEVKL